MAKQLLDVRLGQRVKAARRARRISQERIAEHLCVSPQQIQKYESGVNRLSAITLLRISLLLDMPVWTFFDGLTGESTVAGEVALGMAGELAQLPCAKRRLIGELVRSLAETSGG